VGWLRHDVAEYLAIPVRSLDGHQRQAVAMVRAAMQRAACGQPVRRADVWASLPTEAIVLELLHERARLQRRALAASLRLVAHYAAGHVIDFGGGLGDRSLFAASLARVTRVTYVDVSPGLRDFVRFRARRRGLCGKLETVAGLQELATPPSCDLLIGCGVFETLDRPARVLEELQALQPPGTHAVLNWAFGTGPAGEYPLNHRVGPVSSSFLRQLDAYYLELAHRHASRDRLFRKRMPPERAG
jgi:hypothetical protein